jgi:hypothetical protein
MMSQIAPTPSATKSAEPTSSTAALGMVLVVEDNSSEVVVLTAQEFEGPAVSGAQSGLRDQPR